MCSSVRTLEIEAGIRSSWKERDEHVSCIDSTKECRYGADTHGWQGR